MDIQTYYYFINKSINRTQYEYIFKSTLYKNYI